MGVSIVIPCYNNSQLTIDCIRSIDYYTDYPFELIVINDASTDRTKAELDGYKFIRNKHIKEFRIIHNEKNSGGCSRVWNQGIALAKEDYICIMNNDMMVSEGWLTRLMDTFQHDKWIRAVSPSLASIAALGSNIVDTTPRTVDGFNEYAKVLSKGKEGQYYSAIIGSCFLFPKTLIDEIGVFDEAFGFGGHEDVDWFARLQWQGYSMQTRKDVWLYHYKEMALRSLSKQEHKVADYSWQVRKDKLRAKFMCPKCKKPLRNACKYNTIFDTCKCEPPYKMKNGIYYIYDETDWEVCRLEAEGSVQILKDENAYNGTGGENLDKEPYHDNLGSKVNARMIEMIEKHIPNFHGRCILNIGGKSGWEINHWCKKGAYGVVMDICDDDKISLGEAKRLQKYTKREFFPVCGDGQKIPFQNDTFDMVFICSAFHHFTKKEQAIKEIHRVLKKGGIFADIGEPPRPFWKSVEASLHDVRRNIDVYHINESQPSLLEYYQLLESVEWERYMIYPMDSRQANTEDTMGLMERIAANTPIHPETVKFWGLVNDKTRMVVDMKLTNLLFAGPADNAVIMAKK